MLVLFRWSIIFGIFFLSMQTGHAYRFANLGQVSGPAIHVTYFFTMNNQPNLVRARAYVGQWANGTCIYAGQYDMGLANLKTGNQLYFDANKLASIVGGGYSCVTISYFFKQPVQDTFQLIWNGTHYTNTTPATSDVTIL